MDDYTKPKKTKQREAILKVLRSTKSHPTADMIFEQVRTKVAATPMPNPFCREVLTASAGHKPSASIRIGFSVIIPRLSSSLIIVIPVLVVRPFLLRYSFLMQTGIYKHTV